MYFIAVSHKFTYILKNHEKTIKITFCDEPNNDMIISMNISHPIISIHSADSLQNSGMWKIT